MSSISYGLTWPWDLVISKNRNTCQSDIINLTQWKVTSSIWCNRNTCPCDIINLTQQKHVSMWYHQSDAIHVRTCPPKTMWERRQSYEIRNGTSKNTSSNSRYTSINRSDVRPWLLLYVHVKDITLEIDLRIVLHSVLNVW